MKKSKSFGKCLAGACILCITLTGEARTPPPSPDPFLYVERVVHSAESTNGLVQEVMFFAFREFQYYRIENNAITNYTGASPAMGNQLYSAMQKSVISGKLPKKGVFFENTFLNATKVVTRKDFDFTWYRWEGLFQRLPQNLQEIYNQAVMDDKVQMGSNAIVDVGKAPLFFIRASTLTETQYNELSTSVPIIEMPKRKREFYDEEDADILYAIWAPYKLFPVKIREKPLYFMKNGTQPGDKFLLKREEHVYQYDDVLKKRILKITKNDFFLVETFPNASFRNPPQPLPTTQGDNP